LAYLIDTNIAIHARDGTERVIDQLVAHDGEVMLSVLSLAELQRGLYKNPAYTSLRAARLTVVLAHLPVLPFDAEAADAYGQIIARCGWVKGLDFDRMIAAHAIRMSAILVTDNEVDFGDIPGLVVKNWLR